MTSRLNVVFGARQSEADAEDGEHWLTVSDLMAGLMMVFLFISIALMRSALLERDKIREVAVAYQENQVAINEALADEFEDDLPRWEASIDPETLSFRFHSPEVLFRSGEIYLQPRFQEILSDFFPRYLVVLKQFDESIGEVRIEGHTSSDWYAAETEDDAYFKNMWLSQGRTRAVLAFVTDLEPVSLDKPWIRRNVAAVGFSSARIVTDSAGEEDQEASRRVVFRVVTNAETQIRKILEED